MRTQRWLLAATLLASNNVAAQDAPHVCGNGPGQDEIMAGVEPGGNGVAPTPLCYWKSDSQQETAAPRIRWEDRWGAIASDGEATYGIITNIRSKREAARLAMDECRRRGGGTCEVDRTFVNQCAAVVAGDRSSASANAPTEEEAIKMGKDICMGNGESSCRIYYSGCSLAKRVQ